MKNKYVVYVGLKNIEFEDTNRIMDDIRNSFKKLLKKIIKMIIYFVLTLNLGV